ncbi:glutaredoxin family protein [Deinococcus sp. HMF7604]|uniref:glutaredoxin family protein n=1 Tax=Deinococcus betulae TaxID=2873312 RepID=UPI001CCEECCA|nr:glutaredoxin family protein [Deinococcus betulae]MBZ9752877.1 glutaredoxin family protein [Deinococcus betulae]
MPEITLYTVPNCADCEAVKRLLSRCGAAFRVRDLRQDPSAVAELQQVTDVRVAPVTVIGTQVFFGPIDQQRPGLLAALAGQA